MLPTLRKLYYARFGFALVWAILLTVTASSLNPASVTLLVLYPLVDLAAAVTDFRSSTAGRKPLYLNMALSLLAAIALAFAATSGTPAVLRIWGAWAITAGLVQLTVAILRYRLGAQWPMILSGGISTLAGASFILMASGNNPSVKPLAGYALLGGIFFLLSALRLRRTSH
ncbi:hypothetical protein EV138_2383 [Kribbella voronezhensis]|uniref:Integral membrane protein n=1 Tax=Kribbella voronezhensis TaxID=2512212 RepID=A0A4R7TA00_9ACTN|nr:hypothetical protein [Kribbella voronezhensis]TDU88832.1 hypothetical protein EV138_2383 [Kribbella voronezhensis]